MKRIALSLSIAVVMSSCGGGAPPRPTLADEARPAPPDPVAPVGPEQPKDPATTSRALTAETQIKTASGATFTASAGWTVEERPDRVVLISPERDVSLALFELKAENRDAAIAAAWKQWQPGFNLAIEQQLDVPGRGGWDALAQVLYVTPSSGTRIVGALARRKGDVWYVALLDGTQAGVDRRGAQIGTALESFAVPGMVKESFADKAPHTLDAARLAELTKFIESALRGTHIPGAAVGVVQGGKVVYARGFGVRRLGDAAAVTPKTLFMIGSVNKSLTTLMIARLVERKLLTWDTPVTEVLPSFVLGDAKTTAAVTMRQTACACTGMPRQDLEMIFEGGVSAEERLASMREMQPTTGFGETFQYSNLMVSAGGFAGGHAFAPKKKLGAAYDEAMKKLVFEPLGMKSSTFDLKRVAGSDHAAPHPFDFKGAPVQMPPQLERWVQPIRPAGGLWSNVDDMARFAMLELDRGKLGGKQVVAEDVLLARRQPQIKMTDEMSYGLGFAVGTRDGLQVVTHSGGTLGFTSEFLLLPEHGIGLVILTNAGAGGTFTSTVERRLLEILFDGEPRAAGDLSRRAHETFKQLAAERELIEPADEAWFATLAGTWRAPGLGEIELRTDAGKPVLDAGEWQVEVARKKDRDGTIKLVSIGPIAGLELVPTEQDGKMTLVLLDAQRSYVFERVAR